MEYKDDVRMEVRKMEIQIVIHNMHEPVKTIVRCCNDARDINETVYDVLTKHGINDDIAIDCASWCEIATYGESYNMKNFDVYIGEF